MSRTIVVTAGVLAAVAAAATLQAHHSGSMYSTAPEWVQGAVVSFEDIDPHTITTVEQRTADGQVRRWGIEGPGRSQINRGRPGLYIPQVGDVIEVCGFPYKSLEELARLFPDADFSGSPRVSPAADNSSRRFVAGHIIVMPGGGMRLWEPHGAISQCMRSSNLETQQWLDYLDSSTQAHEAWCEQRGYAFVRSDAALSEFVEGINGRLDNPCP